MIGCATRTAVANTLWSLSQLRWQRAATVSEALLVAVQRVAGSMTQKAWRARCSRWRRCSGRFTLSAAEALARSAHERLPQMDSQGVANVLWAQAWFVASGCASVRLDHGAFFTRAAELDKKLSLENQSAGAM